MNYQLRLQAFEGPFDLLLHLIEKNQVDIYDIPIAEITRQYMEYLWAMEELDLEIASSSLLMAAQLLAIKSRMLVPQPKKAAGEEPEEIADERAGLVHDLLEYMRCKNAAVFLQESGREESRYFDRPPDEELYSQMLSRQNPLEGKTLADLTAAFKSVLAQAAGRPPVMEILREQITVDDKMREIFSLLSKKPAGILFEEIFAASRSRAEAVVTFLALLELVHQAVVMVEQGDSFGEIYLCACCPDSFKSGGRAVWG